MTCRFILFDGSERQMVPVHQMVRQREQDNGSEGRDGRWLAVDVTQMNRWSEVSDMRVRMGRY